jgi:hypothetical protein
MKTKQEEYILAHTLTTRAAFLEIYNRTLPAGYPRASSEILERFRAAHPALFKRGGGWSVALHRKRLMDWMSFRHNLT